MESLLLNITNYSPPLVAYISKEGTNRCNKQQKANSHLITGIVRIFECNSEKYIKLLEYTLIDT